MVQVRKRKIPGWAVALGVALLALFGLQKIGGEPSSIRALGFEVFGTGGAVGGGGNGGMGPEPGVTSPTPGGFFGGLGGGLKELGVGIAYAGTAAVSAYGAYKAVKAAKFPSFGGRGVSRPLTAPLGVTLLTGAPFVGVPVSEIRGRPGAYFVGKTRVEPAIAKYFPGVPQLKYIPGVEEVL